MGKIIEFKKFSKRINKDNLKTQSFSTDIFPEEDFIYIRREIEFNLDEMDELLNCIYKQISINDTLIISTEDNYEFEKTTYLKDFNDKLHDIMYFLTNTSYQNPITINMNFLELQYLVGTLQLETEVLEDSDASIDNDASSDYFKVIHKIYHRLYPVYNSWKKELYEN
ncbi:hypothetical protein [Clostridium aciditolerans]|uniref:Uncharacterized protein n=1 Tax=Clostridium aciditolerans TaxID=339861 RepID=A0A934M0J7_9CLOT|nr:hypothetical protein [Clostridium aciditolerans]MBI6872234.1 hypothetical protein [Clostridium aciditolerans]